MIITSCSAVYSVNLLICILLYLFLCNTCEVLGLILIDAHPVVSANYILRVLTYNASVHTS